MALRKMACDVHSLGATRGWMIVAFFMASAGWSQTVPVSASPADASSDDAVASTTLRTTTREVVLDVIVSNGSGHPLSGLDKNAFTIKEDGVAQSIRTFEENGPGRSHSADTATTEDILLLDEVNTRYADAAYARHCLHRLVEKHGAKLEEPTSLLVLTGDGLAVLHEPTQDGNALLRALDGRNPTLPTDLLMVGGSHDVRRLDLSLLAILKIALTGKDPDHRRNLIWIGSGFSITANSLMTDEGRGSLYDTIRDISMELLRARMAVYTIDPIGVPSVVYRVDSSEPSLVRGEAASQALSVTANSGFGSSLQEHFENGNLGMADVALQSLAVETGGRAFVGRNDVDELVMASEREGAHYYTLTYYPSNRDFNGKFRTISVSVDRSSAVARTRAGYFAIPDWSAPSRAQQAQELQQVLKSAVHYDGIRFDAMAEKDAKNSSLCTVVLRVDPRDVMFKPESDGYRVSTLSTATATFGKGPAPLAMVGKEVSVRVPPQAYMTISQEPIIVEIEIPLTDRVTHLKAVVRDEATGFMGTADVVPTTHVAKP
jgi:VWFA-related protein